jgi:N,N'-diacetyllegionaminate synthase
MVVGLPGERGCQVAARTAVRPNYADPVSALRAWFGGSQPLGVYVIAEAGVNHDGSVADAHRLVDVAADCGADAIKFQTFDPAALASASGPTAAYQAARTGARTQRELLAAYVLPPTAWPELRDHASERGLDFLSTPFDHASLDLVCALGLPAIKLGSGELTNRTLLQAAAASRRPILLSTGMGRTDEVGRALGWLRDAGADEIALFHCVSSYPAPLDQANLRAVSSMREDFQVPIGWSDHTVGLVSAVAAVALGATLIEKHVTLDTSREGPDHAASADPAMFSAYVDAVRAVTGALGDGVKRPAEAELANLPVVRRSWYAVRDLPAGTTLSSDDIVALRPEDGVGSAVDLVGVVVARDILAEEPIRVDRLAGGGPDE